MLASLPCRKRKEGISVAVEMLSGRSASHIRVLAPLRFIFLLSHTPPWEAAGGGSSNCMPAAHLGDLVGTRGSWLRPSTPPPQMLWAIDVLTSGWELSASAWVCFAKMFE